MFNSIKNDCQKWIHRFVKIIHYFIYAPIQNNKTVSVFIKKKKKNKIKTKRKKKQTRTAIFTFNIMSFSFERLECTESKEHYVLFSCSERKSSRANNILRKKKLKINKRYAAAHIYISLRSISQYNVYINWLVFLRLHVK